MTIHQKKANQPKHLPMQLSKSERLALSKLSSVVTTANDPQAALNQLSSTLSPKYLRPLEALSLIMAGKLSNIYAYGLWHTLKHLITYSDKPNDGVTNLAYVQQYSMLERAGHRISQLTGYNWLTVGYFTMLTLIIIISITIFRTKVLPVYNDMFQSYGQQLPKFTQFILNGGFELYAIILLFLTVLYCLILPYKFKKALGKLHQMPVYLMVFPAYYLCRQPYRQYCWQTYVRLYQSDGEIEVLQKAEQAVWGAKAVDISKDDWALLTVASQQGNLESSLNVIENQLLTSLKNRITMADMLIRLMLLLAFAWVVSAPVIAMYLPIFQIGAVMQ